METKQSVIITGAAGGIGQATVLKFAAKQFNITLVDQDEETLQQLAVTIAREYNAASLICAGDLAEMEFLHAVVTESELTWGSIDILVNNAAWRTIETMRTM
jgi:short-subunit dehydrogenase